MIIEIYDLNNKVKGNFEVKVKVKNGAYFSRNCCNTVVKSSYAQNGRQNIWIKQRKSRETRE